MQLHTQIPRVLSYVMFSYITNFEFWLIPSLKGHKVIFGMLRSGNWQSSAKNHSESLIITGATMSSWSFILIMPTFLWTSLFLTWAPFFGSHKDWFFGIFGAFGHLKLLTNTHNFLCNPKGMYCESQVSFISSQYHKNYSLMLREPRFFRLDKNQKSAGIRKNHFYCVRTYVKMKHHRDIVVPEIINDPKSFLD